MNKKIIAWILVALWMFVIFLFSNMTAKESNEKSTKTIHRVIEETIQETNKIGITNKHISEEKKTEIMYQLNGPLRKCMHVSVYLILALLLLNGLGQSNIIGIKKYVFCIIICFLYAITDEYHQTFIDGRTGEYLDVLIDSFGCMIGCIVFKLIKYKKTVVKESFYRYNLNSEEKKI